MGNVPSEALTDDQHERLSEALRRLDRLEAHAGLVDVSAAEQEAIEIAADKAFMEAERLVELKGRKKDPASVVRLVAFWHSQGETLQGLLDRMRRVTS